MASYVVTGASRGLGYEFIRQLSQQPGNTVIGLVRDKAATDKQIVQDKLQNVHILQADITDLKSLQAAKAEIEKITPSIDYLINNAAAIPLASAFNKLTDFEHDPDQLDQDLRLTFETNVLGVIKTINTFLPLVQRSSVKKVISISTGLADLELTNKFDVYEAAPYSISKAAMNAAVAKYNAAHNKDGILFLAISPGMVATGNDGMSPPDSEMPQKFARAFPNFTGPITPEESVKAMLPIFEKAQVGDKKYAGEMISHLDSKQWL